jgi:methionyl aminopeptidase
VYINGWHGDTCATFPVGDNVDAAGQELISVAREAMMKGIEAVKPGRLLHTVGKAIEYVV